MAYCEHRLILASGSPRRRELLEKFSIPFEIIPAGGEEDAPHGEPPADYVARLSARKAAQVAAQVGDPDAVLIAADTVVVLDGDILGKPKDAEDAVGMLSRLSGRTHRVYTGVTVRQGEHIETRSECTSVRFRPLSEREIRAYVATGEPMDKAGAYGYQGISCVLVEAIEGDFFNVVGLPMCRLGLMLRSFGVELL